MMIRKSPSKRLPAIPVPERAASWLRSRIAEDGLQQGDALPSLDALAEKSGVSRHSMWKAMAMLMSEGVITTRRGGRAVVGAKEMIARERRSAPEHIEHELSEAIYQGEFLPGMALPPVSKMQIRFATSFRTLQKILDSLVRQRILVRTGVRYVVPRLYAHGATLEAVLINEGVFDNERQRAMVPLSEENAQKLGVRLVRHACNLSSPINSIEVQRLAARSTVAGFVVDFWGLGTVERTRHFESLLALLYASRKPVSIIDEVGDLELAEPLRSSDRVRILTIAAHVAGEDIGRYLLTAGHRRAVYLTTTADASWSQRRYAGLCQSFARAGMGGSEVLLCKTTPLPGPLAPLVCAAAQLSRDEIETLFLRSYTKEAFSQLLAVTIETSKKLHLKADEANQIRRQVKPAIDFYKAGGETFLADTMRDRIFEVIGGQFQQRLMQPIFRQLLKDPAVTAWVAATNRIGLSAQTFLREQSVKVPDAKTIIAFDNSFAATVENLACYDFDLAGLMLQALSFAVGRPAAKTKAQRVIEWPGILYPRQTLAKASQMPNVSSGHATRNLYLL
jgi:DNA-binding FadR family transcriptional regulator/DNA-binding LacI/PurR family transcriptional regulator